MLDGKSAIDLQQRFYFAVKMIGSILCNVLVALPHYPVPTVVTGDEREVFAKIFYHMPCINVTLNIFEIVGQDAVCAVGFEVKSGYRWPYKESIVNPC
jgi:hypothetical protein